MIGLSDLRPRHKETPVNRFPEGTFDLAERLDDHCYVIWVLYVVIYIVTPAHAHTDYVEQNVYYNTTFFLRYEISHLL